jgi:hypothetical protein
MVVAKQEQALILVKAFPQPSQKYEETVCCAGVNAQGEFVRLYPIRYRHLPPEKRFERWDVLEYEATRPTDDWRPESRHVNENSIRIVQSKAQTNDEQRVRLWAPHVSESLSALKEENKATEKSLGIIRPDPGTIKFKARRLSPTSEDDVQLQAAFKQVSLIEQNVLSELSVEYDFSYHFTSAGHPHVMKIHDWEVQAAYFAYKRRYAHRALDMLRQEYEERIPQRNLHFVMGTMKAHPRQFIIIGLLRSSISPEDAMRQGALL